MPPVSNHQHPDLTESRSARCSGAQRDAGLVGINILELLIILHHWFFFFPPLCLLISLHCYITQQPPYMHVHEWACTECNKDLQNVCTDVFLCSRLYSNSHLAHNNNRTVLGILRIHQIIITGGAAGEGRQKVSLQHFFAGLNQHSQWPLQRWHVCRAIWFCESLFKRWFGSATVLSSMWKLRWHSASVNVSSTHL